MQKVLFLEPKSSEVSYVHLPRKYCRPVPLIDNERLHYCGVFFDKRPRNNGRLELGIHDNVPTIHLEDRACDIVGTDFRCKTVTEFIIL